MAETKQRYKELTTKRASAKGQITKFKNYLASVSEETELSSIELAEFKLKLAKFEALSVRVDDLQSEIEVLYPDNLEEEIDEREIIEQDIITSIATAKTLLETLTKHNDCEQRRNSAHNASCCSDDHHYHHGAGLKLPQIQIEKFSGEYFRWLEFRDTFENLIHKNERIPDINKFHYLASYLQGDAARIISNLEISSKNYADAWKLLCSRYDNKRILINHHLNSLLNIKQLPRESERSLRFLVDHVTKNLRALASLGQPTSAWDALIIFMLSSKLDGVTLMKWEEYYNTLTTDAPTLEQFFKFLTDRANVLESLNRNNKLGDNIIAKPPIAHTRPALNNNYNMQRQGQSNNVKSFTSSTSNSNNKKSKSFSCIICNQSHKIYECPTFKAKSVDDRLKDVFKYKLCKNCLRSGHSHSECRMGPCRETGCSERHNTLLHYPPHFLNHLAAVEEQDEIVVNFSNQSKDQILLSTAIIEVSNPAGQQKVTVRAMLDCGSTASFITESLKSKLSLKSHPIDCLKVIGIGNTATNNVTESCNIKIQSIYSNFNAQFSCLVLKELTGQVPKTPVDIRSLKLPDNIKLADAAFYKPAPIDVLIGADLFWDILGNEQCSLGNNNPKLRSSKLGWIISGPIRSISTNNKHINNNIQCHHTVLSNCSDNNDNNIEKMLTKFWDLEEVSTKETTSHFDHECERHFTTHTTRDENGRFHVKLPLKENADCLGNTYNLARKRFINLEKRFKRNPQIKSEYTKFIKEYEELGHLSISSDNDFSSQPCYYLPHHAVFKQSESTSCRVVFDASAPSTSGYSLNDILMVGPNVQDSLFSILVRARQYKYLLTGDIEKMYRQILVHKDDRHLQLILWREDESQPIKTLILNTLTYGTANASYQSTRCLFEVGEEQDDALIKAVIQKDFYVDDLITGADDQNQLKYIQKSISNALKTGCFNLRKYKTNCPAIFDDIDINEQDNLTISESSSTLGLGWKPSNDTLHFPIKGFSHCTDNNVTKRTIMSNAFKIFDPLGILSAVTVKPKIMLQKLWQIKMGWDDPVPQDIQNDWIKFSNSVKVLSNLQVPRLVLSEAPTSIEMHSFSDASQHAYGACVYIKTFGPNDDVIVRLLCAKSKVAPLKATNTIPRLELCAALLAAKLTKSVLDALRYRPGRVVHWCDSSVVLGWIRGDVTRLKVFVANRVSEIKQLTSSSAWRYCPTSDNPADLVSRGVDAERLTSMTLWWSGPSFLSSNESDWPVLSAKDLETLPDLKVHSAVLSESVIDFEKHSSLTKLQRSFAYVQRFIFNLKNKNNKRVGILLPDELNQSLNLLCAISQRESFPVEYELLENGKHLSNKSRLLALSPFFDNDKLIRVGGRIQASCQPYEKRHPILLSSTHKLTKLYFQREHVNNMHAGPQLLLATVRETVWPINGRHLARRTVNNCTRCRRVRGATLQPKMGNLPIQRVTLGFAFSSVGIDLAGPFYIINRKGRGSRLIKTYLCLFVCMRYKCLHLSALSDLTKDAFIMCLKRFIARRGRPTEIFCDNGTNFVAAAKEIGSFIKNARESLSDFASQQSIEFKFIPVNSPSFGGIWEAGVKSAKYFLRRVIGNSHLTFEEISTLFAQVEAILNSRPLCPLSSSPDDLLSLTPGHFIIGRPLTALPTRELTDVKENQLRRYERVEKMRQHFWNRWQKEYLSEMQQRTKWRTNAAKLNVGDMVLIADDNAPPLAWRLGRVHRLITGPDGISRVADIHTNRGCVRRALTRLCKLPTAEELQS